ncbi:MAG TPA: VWA domain-containing protein [Blastocatellia bacterium]|nr:VWA domain-containing protein [Blastocatellia bacterium]
MTRRLKIKVAIGLWLILAVVAGTQAQSGRLRDQTSRPRVQGGATQDDDTLRIRVEEVLLPVSVRNQLGKLPSDLKRTDFIVTEDGSRRDVNAVMRTPANILFVIDASAQSTIKNINANRELALEMIGALADEDHAAIISYSDRVDLLCGWTTNKKQLRDALNWKFKPGLEADLYNALMYAADEVLSKVNGRRSIVLISDGVDSFEKPVPEGMTLMFEKALAALHRARATVYVASQNEILMQDLKPLAFNALSWYERLDPQQRKRVDRYRRYYRQLEAAEISLKGLAEETGGVMWSAGAKEEFLKLNGRIINEIGTECIIAYSSERQPDDTSFHAIKVYGTRPDITIRFRRGIYANSYQKTTAMVWPQQELPGF